jgi:hypothetical protein
VFDAHDSAAIKPTKLTTATTVSQTICLIAARLKESLPAFVSAIV